MKVNKLGNVVCLVVTGEFNPDLITAQRAVEYDILNKEECRQLGTRRLDASLSVFTISSNIEVLCSKERLQVLGTGDVSNRVPDLTKKLIISAGISKVDSVGVNAFVDFTFDKPEDGHQFGNFFIPLPFWQDYLRDGRVLEFTIAENKRSEYPDSTNSITIKSIQSRKLADGRRVAAVRMSSNYDYRLNTVEQCLEVITKSLDDVNDFWGKSDSILSKVQ